MAKQSPAGGGTEDQDGLENSEDSQDLDAGLDTENEADENDGTDGGVDGEEGSDADADGGETEGAEGDEGQSDPLVQKVLAALAPTLERLAPKKDEGDSGENDVKSLMIPLPNEQQMASLKAKLAEDPSQAVPLMVNLINRAITGLFGQIEGLRADGSLDTAIDSLVSDKSGRFKAAAQFRSGIKQRMSKFAAKDRTNRDLLEMAALAEIGANAGKIVRKKEQGNEVNRRIAQRTRVASPGAGGKGGKGTQALNPAQKEAYLAGKKAGLFKSEKEYMESLRKNPKFRVA